MNFVFLFCSQISLVDDVVDDVLQDPITTKKDTSKLFWVRLRSAYFFWPGGNHKVPCSKHQRFLSDASGQRQLEAPDTSRVQRVGPRGVCLERLRARPKETYRRIANIGPNPVEKGWCAGVGAHLVDSGQDMTLQVSVCLRL